MAYYTLPSNLAPSPPLSIAHSPPPTSSSLSLPPTSPPQAQPGTDSEPSNPSQSSSPPPASNAPSNPSQSSSPPPASNAPSNPSQSSSPPPASNAPPPSSPQPPPPPLPTSPPPASQPPSASPPPPSATPPPPISYPAPPPISPPPYASSYPYLSPPPPYTPPPTPTLSPPPPPSAIPPAISPPPHSSPLSPPPAPPVSPPPPIAIPSPSPANSKSSPPPPPPLDQPPKNPSPPPSSAEPPIYSSLPPPLAKPPKCSLPPPVLPSPPPSEPPTPPISPAAPPPKSQPTPPPSPPASPPPSNPSRSTTPSAPDIPSPSTPTSPPPLPSPSRPWAPPATPNSHAHLGHQNNDSPKSNTTGVGPVATIAVVAGLVMLTFVGAAVWFVKRRRKPEVVLAVYPGGFHMVSPARSSPLSDASYARSPIYSLVKHSSGSYGFMCSPSDPGLGRLWFSFEQLSAFTNGFSNQNLLGEGGFGCVYKGCLPDGREVAVKQLQVGGSQGEREFKAEVEIISRVHHRNLVSLIGYCISENHRLLVYDFVPNNTLHYHLHAKGRPVMDWATRIKVAAGAAHGIAYLHEDCHPRIIHRDIKSSNILLDNNFEAQVSDFGLARLAMDAQTHVTTRVMGTFGYLSPEYASTGKLTAKSDVYSFGVVLLELITGRKPVDTSQPLGDESLVEWQISQRH
ncbi:uncharacterized protein [Elaeis guineensis]|uniref:uncharacterized protein isoform X2 n=1 Tax=Elaeis guineensis var. tenera TaxID=51953 RepID=UPI003C6DB361